MANFESFMVTTHEFKVKDPEAFIKKLREIGAEDGDANGCDGLSYFRNQDGTFWLGGYGADMTWYNEKANENEALDPIVQEHIAPGEYASFQVVGYEKLRHVSGWVVVITEKGSEYRDLDQVEAELKEKLGIQTAA